MGKTHCLGCNKSLGGFLDGFGTRIMAGQVCLTCKKKIQVISNYPYMAPDVLRDFIHGEIDAQTAISMTDSMRLPSSTCVTQSSCVSVQTMSTDGITEELKKYQKLLDEGVISSDEYYAMRKRLLGL